MPIARSRPQTNLDYAMLFVGVVLVVFTVGYRLAGWSWSDALYMVVITAFSVGFGEVVPIMDRWLRAWTIALILFGCTSIIFVTGTLVQWLTEAQIQRALGGKRMENEIEKLSNHAIICGFGRIGKMIATQLQAGGIPFVIVDQAADRVAEVRDAGFLTLQGEATDETVLKAAGIARARVLATVLPNEAANVFITLSARNMNSRIQIIARGEVPSTERKLLQAGANRVVLPAHIGADRIAQILGMRFSGLIAWFMWRSIHLMKLPGLDRKIRAMAEWTFELFFPRDINLLTPSFSSPLGEMHLESGDTLFRSGEHFGERAFLGGTATTAPAEIRSQPSSAADVKTPGSHTTRCHRPVVRRRTSPQRAPRAPAACHRRSHASSPSHSGAGCGRDSPTTGRKCASPSPRSGLALAL